MHEHHVPYLHHGHGWRPIGPRHRWLEPFVLVQIARGSTHGYDLAARLNDACVATGSIDVGELYRTLREMEAAGFVESGWTIGDGGTRRREYRLTEAGLTRLAEWAEVMIERSRLVAEFLAEYRQVEGDAPAVHPPDQEA